jgi:alcohol dehydrogenase
MAQVIAYELEIYGSHGMQSWRYDAMLSMIEAGRLHPGRMIGRQITLEEGIAGLAQMDQSTDVGIRVITRF